MGLDLAEVEMDLEDEFDVMFLEDDTRLPAFTAIGLARRVFFARWWPGSGRCYGAYCFHRLRETIHGLRKSDALRIYPSTGIVEAAAPKRAEVFGRKLRTRMGPYRDMLPGDPSVYAAKYLTVGHLARRMAAFLPPAAVLGNGRPMVFPDVLARVKERLARHVRRPPSAIGDNDHLSHDLGLG